MASFTGQRVLIASLFLPNTVDLSPHPSPVATPTTASPPNNSADALPQIPARLVPKRQFSSIVDDLAVKAHGTPVTTPPNEPPNPLASVFATAAKPPLIPRVSSHTRVPSLPRIIFSELIQPLSTVTPAPAVTTTATATATTAKVPSPIADNERTSRSSAPTGVTRRQNRSSRSGGRRSFSSTIGTNDGRNVISPWEITSSAHGNVGLHKALASVRDTVTDVKWIGILDTPTDEFSEGLRHNVSSRLAVENNIPVWVKDADFHATYNVFCHQVLWPTLHYVVPDAPKTKVVYESSSFAQYKIVNQQFADTIVANYQEGDIVWINDYHLCLVPQLVRQKLPGAAIGFFMHVAWPSTEIFRCLAVREQLLRGLLGSDLLGFQTHNYARHFRQTCSRILSLEALPKGIQVDHSFVDVAVFPIGIDVQDLTQKLRNPEVAEWAKSIRQRYEGKKLIVGRDKLDEVSGVRHKVIAFEEFLERHPEFQGQVVLIQVALSTTQQNQLQASITDVISHVNSRFGSLTYQPAVLLHTQDITFSMYLGLLTAADAFIVTSLREGMALRTHEFVECQHQRKRPLLLSEFTGSYSYSGFRSCIAINPWDYRNTAEAIHEALTMSDDEADSRWEDLHAHVVTQTAQSFVTTFLSCCIRVHGEHVRRNPLSIPILPLSSEVPPSPGGNEVLEKYEKAKNVLMLIDFERTLWSWDPRVTREVGFVVPDEVVGVLKGLVANKKNKVWLLSGLPVRDLGKIADAVPGLGLVAENGCFTKEPEATKWKSSVSKLNFDWKPLCLEILAYFTERTPGSFVEDREASVVWRFVTAEKDEADRQWARRQGAEAQNHVWDSLGERFSLRIIPGERSFLVLPKNVSRSTAVGAILKQDNAPSLLASVSAAAFWNPTGAMPRPPSPGLYATHLLPGTHQPTGPGAGTPDVEEDDVQVAGGTSTLPSISESQPLENVGGGDGGGLDEPRSSSVSSEYDLLFALTGDEPLIRRLNRLEEAQTCSTSGKGSDARWRLPGAEALDVLRKLLVATS